jgi:hypothetical protein
MATGTERRSSAPHFQHPQDAEHLLGRGSEIGVEIGDDVAADYQRREEAAADGLGLSAIPVEDQQSSPAERQRTADALESERGTVRRAVVHEEQVDARRVAERLDMLRREPPGLVEAGDDDGRVGHRLPGVGAT